MKWAYFDDEQICAEKKDSIFYGSYIVVAYTYLYMCHTYLSF